jgi:glycosyltransferase involved in cell wall biosynthesis
MPGRRIFIFSPGGTSAKGGMGRMVQILARRLADDRDIAYDVVDTYGPRVNQPGAKWTMPAYFAAALLRLLGACLRSEIGLAHVHMAAFGSVYRKCVILLVCRAFGVPAIVHIHGGDLDRFCAKGGIGLRLLRTAFRHASRVVVLGAYWRRLAETALGIDPAKISILPNAIPAPPEPGPRDAAPDCEIVFLGYVTPEKGVDDLLRALASEAMAGRRWRLTAAGTGALDTYRRLAAELGIAERIAFVGWVDEEKVKALLAHADLLVLPSHFECLPMAIIEAMAHGLPVIATPVGAIPDAVLDGETGILVPVGSPPALGRAIAHLVDAPSERQRLGRNGRRHFERNFDLERFHARMRAIYLHHLTRAGSGAG